MKQADIEILLILLDTFGCAEYNPEMVEKLWDFIQALLKDQREEVLEDVEHCLGMWVSSEYTSPSYEAECISPKAFWHEWRKLKEELLSSPKKGETK